MERLTGQTIIKGLNISLFTILCISSEIKFICTIIENSSGNILGKIVYNNGESTIKIDNEHKQESEILLQQLLNEINNL